MLYRKPSNITKYLIKGYLVFINGWIAVAYYLVYCKERSYSDILALFWGIIAVMWIYDLVVNFSTFERNRKYDRLAYFLYLMPFIYPLLSFARGLRFPEITSPMMPCSVAVYTIGLMLAFSKKVNIFIVLFLSHWALIGLSKVYFFNIPEDFLLASAAVPALYLFYKEYINARLHIETTAKARAINLSLILLSIVIGIFFTITILHELYHDVR